MKKPKIEIFENNKKYIEALEKYITFLEECRDYEASGENRPDDYVKANHFTNMQQNNYLVCSGCNTKKASVDRNMFDGLCIECTSIALYDDDFAKKAQKQNMELKNNQMN